MYLLEVWDTHLRVHHHINRHHLRGGLTMKKKLLIVALACLCLAGCAVVDEPIDSMEQTVYTMSAHCEIITADGNIWEYDGEVMFDNNGTPDNIYDDIIVGLVP
jgi:outer membrane lipoprotein-sorting protein